jgi:predicted Zn-dependent peptidase
VPVILDELRKSSQTIHQEEIDRARAQIRAQLLMGQESPAARAGQIARQMMLYGRPIPNDEMMQRLGDITTERLTDLAGRLFFDTVPTLSAIGPLENLLPLSDITAELSATPSTKIQANG